MAFSFGSFNKEFLFEIPQEIQGVYLKISEAAEKYEDCVIPVIAFGISTNKSPKAVSERNAWIATDEEFINVPLFQLPEIERMMGDRNAVNFCKHGHMGAMIQHYQNAYGDQLKFVWCDR